MFFLRHHRSHRETAAEALGAREHVWDHPDTLVGVQMSGAPSPSLDLVEDEEGSYLVAQLPQSLQEALRRDVHASLALDRLDQDSGGLRASELPRDRKSTRLNSSHANISYAVFCLKKKKTHHVTSTAGKRHAADH